MKETKKNGAAQSKAGKRDYSAFKNMYRKIPQDLRDVIVYYIGDRPLVIHEGVNEVTGEVVTAEFIRQWHMDRDREVYNNNKHLKPPADENKKKQIREWEEAHPGEKCPDSYNLSLDASFADDEGSEDNHFFLNATSKDAPQVVDRHVQPIMDPMMVYSGCFCNVSVNLYPFNANGNRGVAAGLGNIQFVKDGDRLSGRASADSDFDALEDDEDVLGGDAGEELPDYLK